MSLPRHRTHSQPAAYHPILSPPQPCAETPAKSHNPAATYARSTKSTPIPTHQHDETGPVLPRAALTRYLPHCPIAPVRQVPVLASRSTGSRTRLQVPRPPVCHYQTRQVHPLRYFSRLTKSFCVYLQVSSTPPGSAIFPLRSSLHCSRPPLSLPSLLPTTDHQISSLHHRLERAIVEGPSLVRIFSSLFSSVWLVLRILTAVDFLPAAPAPDTAANKIPTPNYDFASTAAHCQPSPLDADHPLPSSPPLLHIPSPVIAKRALFPCLLSASSSSSPLPTRLG